MVRLRSDFWVSAHIRRCRGAGIEAVQRRRGAAEAGAIFVSVDRLDGSVDLYGPAPQSMVAEAEDEAIDRMHVAVMERVPPGEVEARMQKEIRFDPDLWWIAIDDREGRSALDAAPSSSRGRG